MAKTYLTDLTAFHSSFTKSLDVLIKINQYSIWEWNGKLSLSQTKDYSLADSLSESAENSCAEVKGEAHILIKGMSAIKHTFHWKVASNHEEQTL